MMSKEQIEKLTQEKNRWAEQALKLMAQYDVLKRELASKTSEIEKLREALEQIVRSDQTREFMGNDRSDGYGNEGWVVRDGQYAKIARAAIAKAEGK
jgi:chromosome segregation ATPase